MTQAQPIPFILGILILSGLLLGLIASRIGFPRVAAYVLAGVLFSPDVLGKPLNLFIGPWADLLTTVALATIAYLIGGSFTAAQFKRIGKLIFSIAFGESLGAVILVFSTFFVFIRFTSVPLDSTVALAFAAIAATTAPAGTIAVLHQYRAQGPVSSSLLGIVALDDAIGIILFSLMLAFTTGSGLIDTMVPAIHEIGSALLAGVLAGKLLTLFCRHIKQGGLRFPVIAGSILLLAGLAETVHFSPLLACMGLGFSSRYFLGSGSDHLFAPVEYFEEMVFIIFFTLAGAHFSFSVFSQHLDLILLYLFSRALGKIGGSLLGATLGGAPETVRKWVGFGLVPQAGVAVGLALSLSRHPSFRETSLMIINVILATTLIYELAAPFIVRYGLAGAGEIPQERVKK